MQLQSFQINTFTDNVHTGTRVTVIPLPLWPADEALIKIAKETMTTDTVFVVVSKSMVTARLFTEAFEEDPAGHQLMAAAHALKTILRYSENRILFQTQSGQTVVAVDNNTYNFSVRAHKLKAAALPDSIKKAISIQPTEVYKGEGYLLVYKTEEEVTNLRVEHAEMEEKCQIIATSKGESWDIVSKTIALPGKNPQTYSIAFYGTLIPYWCWKLGKKELYCLHLSERINRLYCITKGKSISLHGTAKTYSIATIWTE